MRFVFASEWVGSPPGPGPERPLWSEPLLFSSGGEGPREPNVVMISLDTVQRKTGEIKNGISNLLRIDDEVKIYQQRLRELS